MTQPGLFDTPWTFWERTDGDGWMLAEGADRNPPMVGEWERRTETEWLDHVNETKGNTP